MKTSLAAVLAGTLAAGLSLAAIAQGGAQAEAGIAHAHALMAQGAGTVDEAHAHLHHVLNCLVGPEGAGFDAKAADPCKGQGNGALPDAAGNPGLQARLRQAVADATAGLQAGDLAAIHRQATRVAGALAAPAPSSP